MARSRTKDEFTKPTATVIGKGFVIETSCFSCDNLESMRIDGTIIGDIKINGVVNISDSGYVNGNISAGSVRVAGRVTGNIRCNYALHLTSSANVAGDVCAEALIVDNGATLLGRCQTNLTVNSEVVKLTSTKKQKA
jgi:cytoskeletal protein CcmA (bactofilin family)